MVKYKETLKTVAIVAMIAGMLGIAFGVHYADNKNKAQVSQIEAAIKQTQATLKQASN